jgi:glucosamine--fructose-6-phosphate aminotransferase (isomerizing)
VKSLRTFPDPFLEEIVSQPAILRRTADALGDQAGQLSRLADLGDAFFTFTGMGASYAACYVPVSVLSGAGVRVSMVDTAELLHFRRPTLGSDGVLVVVSQSGRSAEAVRLAGELDGSSGPLVIAITNGSDNPLADAADVGIDTAAGQELGPSTKTFSASLVALAALSAVVSGSEIGAALQTVRRAAAKAGDSAERILAEPEKTADGLRAWFDDRPILALLGRGTARAASELGSLVLKEAARIPAEAMESAQFRHGPLELAGSKLAVGVVATEPATEDLDRAFATELANAGGSVLLVERAARPPTFEAQVVIGDLDRSLAPAVAALPFELLAWRAAVDRGFTPGVLNMASKVTTRE